MKKIATLILFLLGYVISASAQDQLSRTRLADNLFDRDEYFRSLTIYLDLANKSQAKLHVVERVADCYRLMNDYENAEIWYQKVIAYPDAQMINHYYYAELLLRNKKFEKAKQEYKIYYEYENLDLLPFKLAACDSAQKWMKTPSLDYTLKNEAKFNTKFSDWGLNYIDQNNLVFTSDRKLSEKKQDISNRNGDGYYKLFRSAGDTAAQLELKVKDNPIFSGNYHVGPMVVTQSGDTAYITVTTTVAKNKLAVDKTTLGTAQSLFTRRLQLVVATKVNGVWGNFKNFKYNNIKEYSVGHATLTKDGNTIYFTSDMPEGEGGTDIWYCLKMGDGTWDTPVNCGNVINTKDNESFPNLSADGTSLYFSSNGLPGMGGLDIFKATGKEATWRKPVNLKHPANSTSDDFYFVTGTDSTGYLSSNREGGKGSDDIYSFKYNPKIPVNKPVITNVPASKVQQTPNPNILNPGGVTVINGNAKPVPTTIPAPQPATAIATLKKGEEIILENIYYDLNKSNIRPDAAEELDKLVDILEEYPTIRIEVSSHTDSRAPSAYNLALSKRRAASAVAYLVKKGISAKRLVAVGYGDTRLLNKCEKGEYCAEEDHQINRRTEVKILEE